MSAATLPAPLAAWAEEPGGYNGPFMLLGIEDGMWFGVGDDGHLRYLTPTHITVDWRYDWRNHEWIEVNGIAEEGPDDDGGEDVSGSISDTDGGSDGDSVDQEGRSADGDPGSVDTLEEGEQTS